MNVEYTTGVADGWSVFKDMQGHWHWSAYGPNGGGHGLAPTQDKARESARRMSDSLRRPRRTEED